MRKRPSLALLSNLLIVCATAIVHAGPSPAAPTPSALTGTWRLIAYEDRSNKGDVRFPYGEHPKGILIFDATGHMSIQIMKVPHPAPASGEDEKATPEEKVALFDAYTAYFGTYKVDAARGVVITHVEGDLAHVFIGSDQERAFKLNGDRLELIPDWEADGKRWHGIRVFERVN